MHPQLPGDNTGCCQCNYTLAWDLFEIMVQSLDIPLCFLQCLVKVLVHDLAGIPDDACCLFRGNDGKVPDVLGFNSSF